MNSNLQLIKMTIKYAFGLVPTDAGLCNSINILADWTHYIPESVTVINLAMVISAFFLAKPSKQILD